jgi:hypothetical protein
MLATKVATRQVSEESRILIQEAFKNRKNLTKNDIIQVKLARAIREVYQVDSENNMEAEPVKLAYKILKIFSFLSFAFKVSEGHIKGNQLLLTENSGGRYLRKEHDNWNAGTLVAQAKIIARELNIPIEQKLW